MDTFYNIRNVELLKVSLKATHHQGKVIAGRFEYVLVLDLDMVPWQPERIATAWEQQEPWDMVCHLIHP